MVRTKAKDHDRKRLNILSIAAAVFAREGIARASMTEVAKACGISKANIYHYYDSKNDLVFDILDTYLAQLRNWVCETDLSDQTPPEQLHTITRELLLAYEGMDNEHKIQTEGLPLLDPDKQAILKGYQRDLVGLMAQILQGCAPDTLGTDSGKCRDITMSVFGMLNWFYMWRPAATKEQRLDYAATVADLTLTGLSGSKAT
ncbi:TetR/AcrR family transcriptional regulator [Aestuariibius insulae]|uniref:TetR/AcrR family transcriptional regulator n=1 Tax=Aestuariibius insulae TaxID=2058287 RepID=UPI00345E890B